MYWLSVPRRRSSRRGSGGGAGARVLAGRTSGLPGRRAARVARAGVRHPSCCRADVVSILPPAPEVPTFQTNGVAGRGLGRERVGQGPGRDRVGRRWCRRASRCWGRASWRPGRASRRCGGDRGTGGKHWCGRGRSGPGGVALASTACTPGHGGSRRRECGRASGRDGRTGERRRRCTIVGTGCGLRRNVDSLSGVEAGTLLPNGDVLVTMGVTRTRGCLVDWCSADRCLADRCLSFDRSLCRGGLGRKRRRADGIDVLLQGALLVLLLLLHRRRRSAW